MLKTTLFSSLVALAAVPALADGHASLSGYALSADGDALIVMADLSAPAASTTLNLASAVDAIAWRPVTGDLLGFSNGAIYTIDPANGTMTDLDAAFMDDAKIAADAVTAFDFNNKIDAVRAVSSQGDNLVYFPTGFGDNDDRAGSVRRFTSLSYAEGDAMAGTQPQIFANAYTNAINGAKAGDTFQYALDAQTDALVSLANNAGTLETIGKITVDGQAVDLAPVGGFDIVSAAEGENAAYAVLQMEGAASAGLYSIDLATGSAEMVADLGIAGVSGFAASMGQ